jgi:hypothetical protein
MTFSQVLTLLGSGGGLTVLLLMAAAPFLAELLLPGPRQAREQAVPEQRGCADPVPHPARAA